MLAELEEELRLTGVAICERANRSHLAVTEPVLSGLLDRYSEKFGEKLMRILDEKLRIRLGGSNEPDGGLGVEDGMSLLRLAANGNGEGNRPRTAHRTKTSA